MNNRILDECKTLWERAGVCRGMWCKMTAETVGCAVRYAGQCVCPATKCEVAHEECVCGMHGTIVMFSHRLGYTAHLVALSLHRHVQMYPSLSRSIGNLVEVLSWPSDRSCAGVIQASGYVQALCKPVVCHHPLCTCNGTKEPTSHIWSGRYVPRLPRHTMSSVSHHPEERSFASFAPISAFLLLCISRYIEHMLV